MTYKRRRRGHRWREGRPGKESQEEKPLEKPTLLTPWPWTSSLPNYEKINCCFSHSVCGSPSKPVHQSITNSRLISQRLFHPSLFFHLQRLLTWYFWLFTFLFQASDQPRMNCQFIITEGAQNSGYAPGQTPCNVCATRVCSIVSNSL